MKKTILHMDSNPNSMPRKKKKVKRGFHITAVLLLLIIFAVYFLFPFVWMLSVSLQTESELMVSSGFWDQLIPNEWRWKNYIDVFRQIPFLRYFFNSGIVTGLTVIGTTISASLVAYSFAKLRWPGRTLAYSIMLVTMMIPASVLMIPTYKMYSSMGLTNSWWPLILPAFLGGGAGNIILIEQFFRGVPKEINEAAKIDGAGELSIWRKIMLPLSKPVIATVAVFAFLFSWNDYMGPLIYINDSNLTTVALGLRAFFSQQSTNWSLLMAGSIISMLPNIIIFIFCQRYFLEGMKSGAVKG
ncbi:MAG TPA: sugar ABC transporter ATP-binding protein [Lachnospiraceae bacterium]|jgi:ABC-type glycerol-3-phosphate transport system permease component|nr:sugar ABC transporter ATP-binding protein [Lachnospiraceae bacterium]HCM12721.1 sugar ABC transporter ATP-binding protein [Lachnospiraceae bacterium]